MRYYLSLISLTLLLFSSAGFTRNDIIRISTTTTIENGNWYPLSVKEMKAAAVDTALAQLTKTGNFIISQQDPVDASIRFSISLIGAAEIVKLTISFTSDKYANHVSTVSQQVSNLDHQRIYNAFEYVGKEAAMQLHARLDLKQAISRETTSEDLQPHILKILKAINQLSIESQQASSTSLNDENFSTIFNEAQRLKRKHNYHQARALFEEVIKHHQDKKSKTVKLARDELIYGIPMFQVTALQLDASNRDPIVIRERFQTIDSLLREILANNNYNIERSITINQKLDEVSISLHALEKVMQTQALVGANNLRMLLLSEFAMNGQWPDKESLTQQINHYVQNMSLIDYQLQDQKLHLILKDTRVDSTVTITGSENGDITIQ